MQTLSYHHKQRNHSHPTMDMDLDMALDLDLELQPSTNSLWNHSSSSQESLSLSNAALSNNNYWQSTVIPAQFTATQAPQTPQSTVMTSPAIARTAAATFSKNLQFSPDDPFMPANLKRQTTPSASTAGSATGSNSNTLLSPTNDFDEADLYRISSSESLYRSLSNQLFTNAANNNLNNDSLINNQFLNKQPALNIWNLNSFNKAQQHAPQAQPQAEAESQAQALAPTTPAAPYNANSQFQQTINQAISTFSDDLHSIQSLNSLDNLNTNINTNTNTNTNGTMTAGINSMQYSYQHQHVYPYSHSSNASSVCDEIINHSYYQQHVNFTVPANKLPKSPSVQQQKVNKSLFKTELCDTFEKSGYCPYGEKCQFAHGKREMHSVLRPKKWKTRMCKNWIESGHCRYGKRCCYKHGEGDDGSNVQHQLPSISVLKH